jgi:hypothetical protein
MTERPLTWPTRSPAVSIPYRPAPDFFQHAAIDTVAAAQLGVDRRLHLGLADDLLAAVAGELVGLAQQVVDRAHRSR